MVYGSVIFPIKENDVPRCRDIACILKLPTGMEPVHAVRTQGEFWYHSTFQIPALLGAPRHKAGAPFHPAVKPVPAPVDVTAVALLRQRHLHDCPTTGSGGNSGPMSILWTKKVERLCCFF